MTNRIMELADAMANAYFEQGLERRSLDPAPEKARAALLAEVERVSKDEERYQWLRSNPEWLGWEHDFRPAEVEREIDAAMKEPS